MSATSYAGSGKYDWLLKSVEDKNSDAGTIIETGTINGEKFIAISANYIDEERKRPVENIIILANRNNANEVIAELDLSFRPTAGYTSYTVKFKDNSIFIRGDTGHHGISFSQYQFKEINGVFCLVGVESQSMASSVYSVGKEELNSPEYEEVEMWSGTSINLLTSKAECWLQTNPEWELALSSFKSGSRATKGVSRQVSFSKTKLISLNKFNFYEPDAQIPPFTCHFDHKKKFHGH
jgi:hypothetical protein